MSRSFSILKLADEGGHAKWHQVLHARGVKLAGEPMYVISSNAD